MTSLPPPGREKTGVSSLRPDGPAKVTGTFPFAGDLSAPGMVHGRTLRSPHARARIVSLDIAAAARLPGVCAVVTAADVPGVATYGLLGHDQPVFASTEVRYFGEPVAAVAAVDAQTARRALAAIRVGYEPLTPVVDLEAAIAPGAEPLRPDSPGYGPGARFGPGGAVGGSTHPNIYRAIDIRHGDDPDLVGAVAVEDTYVVGLQDQAFLAPEVALAMPAVDGGVHLATATQWLHSDRQQIAACLGLPESMVRLTLAGVGGAFGGREDVTLQIHAALLATRLGRPVRMAYDRVESFLGHPHRHPALMWYRHSATRDGDLAAVQARVLFDGGAYASTSRAVIANAITHAAGPYRVANAHLYGASVRTNNPPNGAMRGFGVPQVTFAHEAQMDRLADLLGMSPVALRARNALAAGDRLPHGQLVPAPMPARELIELVASRPLPPPLDPASEGARSGLTLPGGRPAGSDPARVRRGVGYALGVKNLLFSEGHDDASTARARLELGPDGTPRAWLHTACAEVGQGFVTIAGQIARTELGVEEVVLAPADTTIGSAGSTSASRQTWMSGGAVRGACAAVAERLLTRVARGLGLPPSVLDSPGRVLTLRDGEIVGPEVGVRVTLAEALADGPVEAEYTHHHRQTFPLDERGQGDAHVAYAAAAHRAVVDVDLDLGLVRVVSMALAQDCGTVLNPLSLTGQVEGGTAQGLGLAVMEELVTLDGVVVNPTFHDYLLPTIADVPDLDFVAITYPQRDAPYGVKGVGEAPTGTATPAVVAAIRDAVGHDLRRVPVRPMDLVAPAPPTGAGVSGKTVYTPITPGEPAAPVAPAEGGPDGA